MRRTEIRRSPKFVRRGGAALGAPRRPREKVSAQVERYAPSFRLPLEVLAREHAAYEDLLFSSPVVAVSLVERRGAPAARGDALHLIANGAPLAKTHAALELPLWLRKLPPEAFLEAPPEPFPSSGGKTQDGAALFDPKADADFGRRALNLTPRAEWDGWLRWCAAARILGGDEFAIWLLSARGDWSADKPEALIGALSAYAWFSKRPNFPASVHLPCPWSSDMSHVAAAQNTIRWLLGLMFACGAPPATSPWGRPRKVRGYVFEPLVGRGAFEAEGEAMRNCMANYTMSAAVGHSAIYALKRGGRSVANMELQPNRREGASPVIAQLLGRGNRKASTPAIKASLQWLEEIRTEIDATPGLPERDKTPFAGPDAKSWRGLISPFVESSSLAAETAFAKTDPPSHTILELESLHSFFNRRIKK